MSNDQPTPSPHDDLEFPTITWTSFDRYARYGGIARAVRACLGQGRHRVLDVGDCAGHLRAFDEGLDVIGLDIEPAAERLRGAVPVHGDGTRLPFADDTFDAVVSSDVLEHIPPAGRATFLSELQRVSRDLVVVAAPFDTPGVAGVEDLVRRYAGLALGGPQPQLEEHQANGLPSVSSTIEALVGGGATVVVTGNGNLWDWLAFMLLRFQLESRPALQPLVGGYDLFYNRALADRSDIGPFYRQVLVARTAGTPSGGGPEPAHPAEPFPPGLVAALITANVTEVSRQDTVPALDGLVYELSQTHMQTDRMERELARANGELDALRAQLLEIQRLQIQAARPMTIVADRTRRLRAAVRALFARPG